MPRPRRWRRPTPEPSPCAAPPPRSCSPSALRWGSTLCRPRRAPPSSTSSRSSTAASPNPAASTSTCTSMPAAAAPRGEGAPRNGALLTAEIGYATAPWHEVAVYLPVAREFSGDTFGGGFKLRNSFVTPGAADRPLAARARRRAAAPVLSILLDRLGGDAAADPGFPHAAPGSSSSTPRWSSRSGGRGRSSPRRCAACGGWRRRSGWGWSTTWISAGSTGRRRRPARRTSFSSRPISGSARSSACISAWGMG